MYWKFDSARQILTRVMVGSSLLTAAYLFISMVVWLERFAPK